MLLRCSALINMTDRRSDTQVLRDMLGLQVTEEQLESIADRTIQEADLDRDDAISFEEFRKVSPRIQHSVCFMFHLMHC